MTLAVVGVKGSPDYVLPIEWDQPLNEPLVHQVVKACEARSHHGASKQKTRAEVSGGGRKPWRQKRTGRARAGSTRGPIWRKGGVTFASRGELSPTPKVNKKMFRGALRHVLVEMARHTRLSVATGVMVDDVSTKAGLKLLSECGFDQKRTLIVVPEPSEALTKSLNNIPYVDIVVPNQLTPLSVLRATKVIFEQDALVQVQEWLR